MAPTAVIRRPHDDMGIKLAGHPMAFLVTGNDTKHPSMFDWTIPPRFSTGRHVIACRRRRSTSSMAVRWVTFMTLGFGLVVPVATSEHLRQVRRQGGDSGSGKGNDNQGKERSQLLRDRAFAIVAPRQNTRLTCHVVMALVEPQAR